MYNHFRTLLRNGPAGDPLAPGAELVPAGFRPVRLPPHLCAIRARLFGLAPDGVMLDYRVRQLLAAVHAAGLRDFATALDGRLTYDLEEDPYPAGYFGATADAAGLEIAGEPALPDESGRCAYAFSVSVEGGSVNVVGLDNATATATPDPFVGGLSAPVALGDTGYAVRARAGGGPWEVLVRLRPARGLPEVLASVATADAALGEAFGAADDEPYATFRALWERHTELPSRLGGAVCALVYRSEEERRRVGP